MEHAGRERKVGGGRRWREAGGEDGDSSWSRRGRGGRTERERLGRGWGGESWLTTFGSELLWLLRYRGGVAQHAAVPPHPAVAPRCLLTLLTGHLEHLHSSCSDMSSHFMNH